MDNRVPVPKGLLQLYSTLSHDVFDRNGHLLLKVGTVLESEALIERLEEKGHFDPEAIDTLRAASRTVGRTAPSDYVPDRGGGSFSAISALNHACARLQAVLEDPGTAVEAEVTSIAELIARCCSLDGDASLATLLHPLPFPYHVRHPVNVATLTSLLLLRSQHDAARRSAAVHAALTMDIGALNLKDILYRAPSQWTDDQRSRVHAHSAAGVEALLARGVRDPLWLAIVTQHHEALDGSGFPSGLTANRILPEAQAVAIACTYCALISEQPQREALLPPEALKALRTQHAAAVAPELTAALISALGIFPPGMFVRLVNRETAVVVRRLIDPRHPVVFAICGPSGMPYEAPRKRMTASQPMYAIERCIARKQCPVTPVLEELWPPTQCAAQPTEAA